MITLLPCAQSEIDDGNEILVYGWMVTSSSPKEKDVPVLVRPKLSVPLPVSVSTTCDFTRRDLDCSPPRLCLRNHVAGLCSESAWIARIEVHNDSIMYYICEEDQLVGGGVGGSTLLMRWSHSASVRNFLYKNARGLQESCFTSPRHSSYSTCLVWESGHTIPDGAHNPKLLHWHAQAIFLYHSLKLP